MTGPSPRLRRRLVVAGVLSAATLSCFFPFVSRGVYRIADDTLAIHYPVLAGAFARLRRGEWPQWFPEILLGYPGLGSVEFHLFSPFHWAFLVCSPETAIALRFLSIHLTSALAMFGLARVLQLGQPAAVVAALLWALGPSAMFMLIEPMASATVPWFPLLLLCWHRARESRRASWLAVGGLSLGLALLGGHLQHVLWFGLFAAAYTAFVMPVAPAARRATRPGWTLAAAAGIVLMGLAVAAVELVPSHELYRDSIRVVLDAGERLPREQASWLGAARLLPATILAVEKPRFSLEYARVGLVALALALVAVGRGRRFDNRLLLLGAAFLLLALGDVFPPSNWLLRTLPGNRFRFAERIGLVFSFAISILAGRGADRLLSGERGRLWRRLAALALLAAPAAWHQVAGGDPLARQEATLGLIGLALLVVGLLAAHPRVRLLALALAMVSMLSWSARAARALTESGESVGLASGRSRAGEASPGDSGPLREDPVLPEWQGRLARGDEHGPTRFLCVACPRGNAAFLSGHETPTGYVTLRPRRVEQLVYSRQRVSEPEADLADTLGRRPGLLDLLGVRYLVIHEGSVPPGQVEPTPAGVVVSRAADGLAVLDRGTQLPRAHFVRRAIGVGSGEDAWRLVTAPGFDPRRVVVLEGESPGPAAASGEPDFAPARVTLHRPERVEVEVDAPAPGWVVLLDRWAAGWSCRVDGLPAPVRRAQYVFRAVAVDAGSHHLRFDYRDEALARGARVSLLGLALVSGIVLRNVVGRRAEARRP